MSNDVKCTGTLMLAQMGYDDGGIELFCGVLVDVLSKGVVTRAAPCGFRREVGYEARLSDVLAASMDRDHD